MMYSIIFGVLLFSFCAVSASIDLCGVCDKAECMPPVDCQGQVTNDTCGCCLVCKRSEGEICGGIHSGLGKCKEGYFCQVRHPHSTQNSQLPAGSKVGRCEPELCKGKACGIHQWCTVANNETQCICPFRCNSRLDPVCGLADGKDYKNKCLLKQRECKLQIRIGWIPGHCAGCVRNGVDYKIGEKIKGKERCETCTCSHGNWVCSLSETCLREEIYQGFDCTGYSKKHSQIECEDGYWCNITVKGHKDGYADRGVCQPLIPGNVCKLKADAGPCYGYHLRWYYNEETGKCEKFYYGGCKGNLNRFKKKSGCQAVCIKGTFPTLLQDNIGKRRQYSNPKTVVAQKKGEFVTVKGKIKLDRDPGILPNNTCLILSIDDVSYQDAPSVNMATKKMLLGSNMTDMSIPYNIRFHPEDGYRRYSVSAVLNMGWCRQPGNKIWLRYDDYLTTTTYDIPLENGNNTFSIDVLLEYYGKPVKRVKPVKPVAPTLPPSPPPPPPPKEEFPFTGGEGTGYGIPPIKFSNKTMTVSGSIIFDKDVAEFPMPSCMVLKLEDISVMDVSSIVVVEQRTNVSGLTVKDRTIRYSIESKKPIEEEFYRTFAVSAVFNLEWCPKKGSGKWLRNGDFLTDTNFLVTLDKKKDNYERDIKVIYYCRSSSCRRNKERPLGDIVIDATKEKTCYVNTTKTHYPVGAEWKTKDCKICLCKVSGPDCSPVKCGSSCKDPLKVKDSCCPVCPPRGKLCTDNDTGKKYKPGERWRGRDDCKRCECLPNGFPMCATPGCRDPICVNGKPVKVPGLCCRVCSDLNICKEKEIGETYVEGGIWQLRNCTVRYCSPTGIRTLQSEEIVKKCPYPARLTAHCPGLCPRRTVSKIKLILKKEKEQQEKKPLACEDKSKIKHEVGTVWYPEPCKACICTKNKKIRCLTIKCKAVQNCSKPVKLPRMCCPMCKKSDNFCIHNDVKYASGRHIVKKDNCTLCACSNGEWSCSNDLCKEESDECRHKGKIYAPGSSVLAGDGCNTCYCFKGSWSCTEMGCVSRREDKKNNDGSDIP